VQAQVSPETNLLTIDDNSATKWLLFVSQGAAANQAGAAP
jgi:hypothetical protein